MKDFNKKISKSGAITLPAALRREYGLTDGERFKIAVKPDGTITLQRSKPCCVVTGVEEDLIVHNGKYLSKTMIEHLYLKIKGGDAE